MIKQAYESVKAYFGAPLREERYIRNGYYGCSLGCLAITGMGIYSIFSRDTLPGSVIAAYGLSMMVTFTNEAMRKDDAIIEMRKLDDAVANANGLFDEGGEYFFN